MWKKSVCFRGFQSLRGTHFMPKKTAVETSSTTTRQAARMAAATTDTHLVDVHTLLGAACGAGAGCWAACAAEAKLDRGFVEQRSTTMKGPSPM